MSLCPHAHKHFQFKSTNEKSYKSHVNVYRTKTLFLQDEMIYKRTLRTDVNQIIDLKTLNNIMQSVCSLLFIPLLSGTSFWHKTMIYSLVA